MCVCVYTHTRTCIYIYIYIYIYISPVWRLGFITPSPLPVFFSSESHPSYSPTYPSLCVHSSHARSSCQVGKSWAADDDDELPELEMAKALGGNRAPPAAEQVPFTPVIRTYSHHSRPPFTPALEMATARRRSPNRCRSGLPFSLQSAPFHLHLPFTPVIRPRSPAPFGCGPPIHTSYSHPSSGSGAPQRPLRRRPRPPGARRRRTGLGDAQPGRPPRCARRRRRRPLERTPCTRRRLQPSWRRTHAQHWAAAQPRRAARRRRRRRRQVAPPRGAGRRAPSAPRQPATQPRRRQSPGRWWCRRRPLGARASAGRRWRRPRSASP